MSEGGALPEDTAWKRRLETGSKGSLGKMDAREALAFADFALNRVSRTFALNIQVLPRPLRDQVLYAYLYCRMADTIEDDATLPALDKARLLHAFAALFNEDGAGVGARGNPAAFNSFDAFKSFEAFPSLLPASFLGTDDWEKILLERAPVVLQAYPTFPAPARAAIARCVTEMCDGMADFALRHERGNAEARSGEARSGAPSETAESTEPLIRTVAELDQYCYYVAGTVGIMLCDLFVAHSRMHAPQIDEARAARMRALCVSFGLGLQLTNILKDLRDDSDRGVVWLPADLLAAEGLTPATYFLPENRAAAGRVYQVLFAKARAHLAEALEYTCLIPRWHRRLQIGRAHV